MRRVCPARLTRRGSAAARIPHVATGAPCCGNQSEAHDQSDCAPLHLALHLTSCAVCRPRKLDTRYEMARGPLDK